MLVVHAVIALVAAVAVWYGGARLLALFIVATETRHRSTAASSTWGAISTALTFMLFLVSISVWIGLTYALERLGSR